MVCLGNRDHSVIFEIASKYCILDSFVDHDGYSISSEGFLAPRGEEFNPGPETRLDRSELLCNKVLLKCKEDRESF